MVSRPLSYVLILFAFMGLLQSAAASNIDFLNDTPIAHFNNEDRQLYIKTMSELMDQGAAGETRTWSNPNSSAKGEIKIIETYEKRGMRCRAVELTNQAKGRKATSESRLCEQTPGVWKSDN